MIKLNREKVLGKLAAVRSRSKKRFKDWVLKRRRARASGKKGGSKRSVYVLTSTLLLLLGLFWMSIKYLDPDTKGRELSFNQFSDLIAEERLDSAKFHDEDAIITGTYASRPPVVEEEPADEGKKTEGKKGDAKASQKPEGEGAGSAEQDQDGGSSGNDGSQDGGAQAGEEPVEDATAEDEPLSAEESSAPGGTGTFWVAYPQSDAATPSLLNAAVDAGAQVDVDPQSNKGAVKLVATFLIPLMILANLFALLFSASKGGGSGIGEVMSFGAMNKKGIRRKKKSAGVVTFDDVAGADEAVTELKEVVDYLKDPERYDEVGAVPPKGVLMVGPPGCGKTLIAKAVAGEAGVPFFSVAGAEFVESLVGVGAARVRDLFQRVRAVAPAIVFIDELDAAGRKRGTGGSDGGSDEREQTLNQMLVEMDGFEVSGGIVVMGATNRPDILDPALLRPGRFDRHVTVDQPDLLGRVGILELHAQGRNLSPTVDFSYIARRTPGFSGADLANVVNESALLALRENKPEIETTDLEEAIQRVLHGPKKKGQVLTPEERKRTAYHEGGHAIVAAAAGRFEDIHRVTILSRGKGIGGTSLTENNDAVLFTKSQLIANLVITMGGLAAEIMVFGEPSTGAEADLAGATDLAQDMVGRFGMGSRRRRLLTKEGNAFLGDELLVGQISSQTHQEMEKEIDMLISEAEEEASRLLAEHRGILDMLADRLEMDETLEGADLEAILAQVRPEVTFFGGPGEGPIRHDNSFHGPMEQV